MIHFLNLISAALMVHFHQIYYGDNRLVDR
ncbi:hypothetical protein CsSME_00051149 [Camellia sinensis var. sinensis]